MVKYLFEFSVEGTKYQRCDFENGFCGLNQISNSVLSGWIRTVNAPGLQHDHKSNTSGTTLNFELLNTSASCNYISSSLLFFPIGHFLSLVPSGGNRTTADLISPVFLSSQTCQVPKTLLLEYVERCRHSLTITLLTFFSSTVEFLLLCWHKTWTSSGLCPE